MNQLNKRSFSLFLAALAAGCAADYEVKPDPIENADVVQYQVVGPFDVQGMQQSRFKELHEIGKLRVDYREVAGAAANMLSTELDTRTGAVGNGAPKTIHIHISDMSLMGNFECLINFVVETGDGYSRGYQAYGKNWDFTKVCNKAFPEIATKILGDPNIRAYLQE